MKKKDWQTYYGKCGLYITSLHSQLLAVMSIKGAIAIGGLAAMGSGWKTILFGSVCALVEIMLVLLAIKLFVQCGEVCRLMSKIEIEKLELPKNLALKTVLMKKPLFTSKVMQVIVVGVGLLFAGSLIVAGFALHNR